MGGMGAPMTISQIKAQKAAKEQMSETKPNEINDDDEPTKEKTPEPVVEDKPVETVESTKKAKSAIFDDESDEDNLFESKPKKEEEAPKVEEKKEEVIKKENEEVPKKMVKKS